MLSREEAFRRYNVADTAYWHSQPGSQESIDFWCNREDMKQILNFWNSTPTQQLCTIAKQLKEEGGN